MNGVICIDKPSGITSFDVVTLLKHITHEKKTGHAGTLDPMATGVLPVFFGEATKAIPILPSHDKSYTAHMRLGTVTDTGDITGKVISNSPVTSTKDDVSAAVLSFKGNIEQVPPMYSALKVNGRHLYDLAREGIEVERKARPITIYNIELAGIDSESGDYIINVDCSQGTYIRTLCEDIGKKLGCGATMSALRRTSAAGFTLCESHTVEEVKKISNEDNINKLILKVDEVFKSLQKVNLSIKQAIRFRNGGKISLERVKDNLSEGLCSIYYGDVFIGVGEVSPEKGEISIKGHFNRDIELV